MKKVLKVSIVIALLLSGLLLFTGCDNKEENEKKKEEEVDLSSVAGTYTGKYYKLVGDKEKIKDEEFSLELKKDGTGVHNRDDSSYKVTWSLEGKDFKMSEKFVGDPIEYTGTLENDRLDIYNGDPDDIWTYEYVYTKDKESTTKNSKKTKEDDVDKDEEQAKTTDTKKRLVIKMILQKTMKKQRQIIIQRILKHQQKHQQKHQLKHQLKHQRIHQHLQHLLVKYVQNSKNQWIIMRLL